MVDQLALNQQNKVRVLADPQRNKPMVDLILPDKDNWYYICPITDNIFLGNAEDAQDEAQLKELGITAVLNVSRVEDNGLAGYKMVPGVLYKWIQLLDGPGNTKEQFLSAVTMLGELLAAGHKTLVHCRMGISRSPAIIACHLSTTGIYSLNQAVDLIGQKRPIIEINKAHIKMIKEILGR